MSIIKYGRVPKPWITDKLPPEWEKYKKEYEWIFKAPVCPHCKTVLINKKPEQS